jgi:hypothetical protein
VCFRFYSETFFEEREREREREREKEREKKIAKLRFFVKENLFKLDTHDWQWWEKDPNLKDFMNVEDRETDRRDREIQKRQT